MEKLDSESNRLQQELQDSKDQNELLEFRILELEVRHKGKYPAESETLPVCFLNLKEQMLIISYHQFIKDSVKPS